ncbi:hypothetical protein RFF05_00350 [Bengtsoniella intestinalis]|uniref:hypothetical protein n=1 Tax=Bengtsoniella intestinalis TaxID=3073143 RepID=UPI00391F6CCA
MNLFLMTVLASAPLWMLLVIVVFLLARWSFSRHRKLLRFPLGLLGCVAVVGMIYGLLRYNGVIVFADDTYVSYHWFGSSYGDEGYKYICISSSVLLGIGIAFLNHRRI